MNHKLKTWPLFFNELQSGMKTFELRKDDRHFQKGDTIVCEEYDPDGAIGEFGPGARFTGRSIKFMITYVLGNMEGLTPGYVILGIQRTVARPAPSFNEFTKGGGDEERS